MALEQLQFGVENPAAHGTAVAADTRFVGEATIDFVPDHRPIVPADDIGLKVNGYRAVETSGKLVQGTLNVPRAYYQVFPWLFSHLIKGGITPSMQTALQNDYLWTFEPSLTASNTLDSSTVELGDSVQAFEIEYLTLDRMMMTITLPQDNSDAVVKLEAGFFARQNTKTTFTASVAVPTVSELNSLLAKIYVDSSWATIGNTEKTGILRQVELEILNGAYPEFNGNGLVFTTIGEGKFAVLCTLTLVNGSDAIALFDATGDLKFVKVLLEGDAIGTGDKHSVDIQFSCAVMEVIPGASKDKETSLTTVMLEGVYAVTGTAMLKAYCTTNLATI